MFLKLINISYKLLNAAYSKVNYSLATCEANTRSPFNDSLATGSIKDVGRTKP